MKYDYEIINEKLHPVINGTLIGPLQKANLSMIIDTGFDGHILIPSRLYKKFGFQKYEHKLILMFGPCLSAMKSFWGETIKNIRLVKRDKYGHHPVSYDLQPHCACRVR